MEDGSSSGSLPPGRHATEDEIEHRRVGRAEAGDERGGVLGQLGDDGGALERRSSTIVGTVRSTASRRWSSSASRSSRPAWKNCSRKRPSRGSNGVCSRTSATSASSGRSTISASSARSERVDALDVDLRPPSQRQHALVLQEHERPALGIRAALAERRLPDDLGGRGRVDVGLVEEAEAELLPQKPAHGDVETLFENTARVDETDEHVGAHLAAELVDAGVEGLQHSLLGGQVLDAPGARRPDRAGDGSVVQETPVGADDAVEAVALAQQAVIRPC